MTLNYLVKVEARDFDTASNLPSASQASVADRSRIASASIVISTVLPRTTPLLSKVLFQLTPKSWRLIVALAVKPALVPYPLRLPTMESTAARDNGRAAAPSR